MSSERRFRFQMYKHLQSELASIYSEARAAARDLGITPEIAGSLGLTGAVSNVHGLLTERVSRAVDDGARKVINSAVLDERVRELVKGQYGDEWDAACVNTCEAALWVTFDCLFTPPFSGRGDGYRTRYLAPYERHLHHQGGYGRPFPPRYKDIFADRGATAGELGFYGKRQADLDVVYVPMAGARYECHGIKNHPVPLLAGVDALATAEAISVTAGRHQQLLSGFTSLGYDTVGYGYGEKAADGVPVIQASIGSLARQYNVPYVVDNAWGVPFLGADPRRLGADVMVFSMDKAAGAPTAGLIIGREEPMVAIRRALGIHGDRWGTLASHGKAAYVTNDPGKEALLGVIAALEALIEERERYERTLDRLFLIVQETFLELPASLREGWLVSKSCNSQAVEMNYEGTWRDGKSGLPIFSIEDMYAGTHILQAGMTQMGIIPTIAYDANIFISAGLGTTDEQGELIEDRVRLMVRAQLKLIEILARKAGVLEVAAPIPA